MHLNSNCYCDREFFSSYYGQCFTCFDLYRHEHNHICIRRSNIRLESIRFWLIFYGIACINYNL